MRRLFLLAAALTLWGAASSAFADYIIVRVIVRPAPDSNNQPEPGGEGGQQPAPRGPGGLQPGGGGEGGRPGGPGGGLQPGGGGFPGEGGGSSTIRQLDLKPTEFVTAVVEFSKYALPERIQGVGVVPPSIFTKHGKTYLYKDDAEILTEPAIIPSLVRGQNPVRMVSPAKQFDNRYKIMKKTPEALLDAAAWCLGRGLPDKCMMVMDELTKMADGKNTGVKIDKAIKGFNAIKPLLTGKANGENKAKDWSARLGKPNIATSAHFAMIHDSQDPVKDGVERRLAFLERNYQMYYLWFALRGKALPMPEEKLVGVLLSGSEDFRRQRKAFEVDELVGDSFLIQDQNVAVYSGQRLDVASVNFRQQMLQPTYRSFEREDLLKGKFPMANNRLAKGTVGEIARAQTIALVDAALQEESELAAASHEGTRQLLAASGLVSANSPAPQWVRFGLASFFEMPKGPFPNSAPVKVAFWHGAGAPNWAYMKSFEEMLSKKELYTDPRTPDASTVLIWTVTDAYFGIAAQLADLEERARGGAGPAQLQGGGNEQTKTPTADVFLNRARTLSWSLTYYLMQVHFDEFIDLLQELSTLPRDAEMDKYSLLRVFGKALKLNSGGTDQDHAKLPSYVGFAQRWLDYMKRQRSLTEELRLETPAAEPTPTGPGGPGGPGGPMGPGGRGPG